MELLGNVDIVNCLGGGDDSFMSFLINEDASNWVVKIHFIEWGSGFTLEYACIMTPEVEIAVTNAKKGTINAAFNRQYLPTADLLPPNNLVSLRVHDAQLPLACSKHQIGILVIG